MKLKELSADVITRPGELGDAAYPALEIQLKGFSSPYVLTLAFPAVVYRALSQQVDPRIVYDAIVSAVNKAKTEPALEVPRGDSRA
jgi:hypothetical protein